DLVGGAAGDAGADAVVGGGVGGIEVAAGAGGVEGDAGLEVGDVAGDGIVGAGGGGAEKEQDGCDVVLPSHGTALRIHADGHAYEYVSMAPIGVSKSRRSSLQHFMGVDSKKCNVTVYGENLEAGKLRGDR